MRTLLFLVTFTAVSYLGEATLCPKKCSPDPHQPIVGCIYRCRRFALGTYFDGTPCYILRRLGETFNWTGNCSKGICIKFSSRHRDSPALRNCYHRSTSQTLPTPTSLFEPGTSHKVTTDVDKPTNSHLEVTLTSASVETSVKEGKSDARASTDTASGSTISSATDIENTATIEQETTAADAPTNVSSEANSSTDTQDHSNTTSADAANGVSTSRPAPSLVLSSSGSTAENVTPTKDATPANDSIHVNSTPSTSAVTEDQSESRSPEETTEDTEPTTRTYGTRPAWLDARFKSTTTTEITPKAHPSSSTAAETSAESSSTVSTKGTESSVEEKNRTDSTPTTMITSPTVAIAC